MSYKKTTSHRLHKCRQISFHQNFTPTNIRLPISIPLPQNTIPIQIKKNKKNMHVLPQKPPHPKKQCCPPSWPIAKPVRYPHAKKKILKKKTHNMKEIEQNNAMHARAPKPRASAYKPFTIDPAAAWPVTHWLDCAEPVAPRASLPIKIDPWANYAIPVCVCLCRFPPFFVLHGGRISADRGFEGIAWAVGFEGESDGWIWSVCNLWHISLWLLE